MKGVFAHVVRGEFSKINRVNRIVKRHGRKTASPVVCVGGAGDTVFSLGE